MKVGFGKKAKKNKQKKGKKKGKSQDGDVAMQTVQPGTPVKAAEEGAMVTAKDKQRQRMELKKALRVTVSGLKNKRNKLTKLTSNKKPAEKKIINKQIQGLLQEQILHKGKQAADGHTMAE